MADVLEGRLDSGFFTRVIAQHGIWKFRLHEAIRTGVSAFTVDNVAVDNKCALGMWLYSDDAKRRSHDAHYERARTLHAQFHRTAAEVLGLAVAGRADDARRALESGSDFLQVSSQLVRILDAWRAGMPVEREDGDHDDTFVAELIGTAIETAAQADVAADAAGIVGSSVEALAGATEQMTATIKKIASSSSGAAAQAGAAVAKADALSGGVSGLTEAVGEIKQVMAAITAIARQTNLLALNATIEAARAGEAGRGFAVVAQEVRDLARRSAEAADEVTRRVASIQERAAVALREMEGFSDGIRSVHDAQQSIAAAVEQQTAATSEISRRVTEAADAGRQIAENAAALALAARNSSVSASRLRDR